MEYTKGNAWEKHGNKVEVFERGIICECPSPQNGGVVEFVANAHLIAQSPRMAKWITKVSKQNFVVFPEDKRRCKEIIQMLA